MRTNPVQLPLGIEPPRVPRAINAARPVMIDGWCTPRSYNQLTEGDEVLVAFLDGWHEGELIAKHEGTLDWPERRLTVTLRSGAELEINDLGALAIVRPDKKKRR